MVDFATLCYILVHFATLWYKPLQQDLKSPPTFAQKICSVQPKMLSRLGGKPINKQLQSRAISNYIGEEKIKIHNYNKLIVRQRNLRDFDDLVQ